jgi:hypothetical protein
MLTLTPIRALTRTKKQQQNKDTTPYTERTVSVSPRSPARVPAEQHQGWM